MTRHQRPIDERPFQARSAQELQQTLEQHYHRIAIPELAAALRQMDSKASTDNAEAKAA